jgi:Chlorophyll A-B binding protein
VHGTDRLTNPEPKDPFLLLLRNNKILTMRTTTAAKATAATAASLGLLLAAASTAPSSVAAFTDSRTIRQAKGVQLKETKVLEVTAVSSSLPSPPSSRRPPCQLSLSGACTCRCGLAAAAAGGASSAPSSPHLLTQGCPPSFLPPQDELMILADKLNPKVRYYDPLDMVSLSPWGFTVEQNIGWLRHSEIKHGRVSMAAFVGYVVQSNYHFPWKMTLAGDTYPSLDLSPPEQWDALPDLAKYQIIAFIGFLEFYSELTPSADSKSALPHYVNGGVPGKFPTFEDIPHPMPFNLYDPFGLSRNRTPEAKARGLVAEINNGRLAMLGILYVLRGCWFGLPFGLPGLLRINQARSPLTPSRVLCPPFFAAAFCRSRRSRGPSRSSPASSSRTRARSWRRSREGPRCRPVTRAHLEPRLVSLRRKIRTTND